MKNYLKQLAIEDGRRMTMRDYILLCALLLIYSLFAFVNLGSIRSPQTEWIAENGATAVIDFGELRNVTEIRYFAGIRSGEVAVYDQNASPEGTFDPNAADPVATLLVNWNDTHTSSENDMFKWQEESCRTQTRFLVLYVTDTKDGSVILHEIACMDGDEIIPATVYMPRDGAEHLLDEQDAVPENPTFLDSMVFDEIYHARTAYEILKNDDLLLREGAEAAAEKGYSIYETTHPTLGKLFIAIGIRIFGMTPFGWRFSGTFFGVLILAVLYVFGKRIFRRSDYAFITAALFAADCMHFAQTRLATIDTYALFFTLLMFLFMGDYIAEDFDRRPYWKKIALLGLSGLMFGLGASSKWTCLYSGGGLALLYFGDLIYNIVRFFVGRAKQPKEERKKIAVNFLAYAPVVYALGVLFVYLPIKYPLSAYRYTEYDAAKGMEVVKTETFEFVKDVIHNVLLQSWFYGTLLILTGVAIASAVVFRFMLRKRGDVDLTLHNLLMTPVWCCLFFIVIPLALYVSTNYCYYVENNSKTLGDMLDELWSKQYYYMYEYHSNLVATHPCQSEWYRWPLSGKEVWLAGGVSGDSVSYIASTGNPAVWYVSAFGAIFAAVEWFKNRECRKDRAFAVVLAGILAGLLPWTLVTRCVFLYHYFSTLPFMMLMTLLLLYYVEKKYPRLSWLKWAWLIAAVAVFLLMLPAVSGIPTSKAYARFIEKVLSPFGEVYNKVVKIN